MAVGTVDMETGGGNSDTGEDKNGRLMNEYER